MNQVETTKSLSASIWGCSNDEVYPEDVSDSFPWIRQHTLMLVMNSQRETMLIALGADGKPMVFRYQAGVAANLETFNQLLHIERIKLPTGIPPLQLAQAARCFLLGLGGMVGSPAFLEEQKDSLDLWTSRAGAGGMETFTRQCDDPLLTRHGDQWDLQFSIFNAQGGVERWHVSGDAQNLGTATFDLVVPDNTFVFPYGW